MMAEELELESRAKELVGYFDQLGYGKDGTDRSGRSGESTLW